MGPSLQRDGVLRQDSDVPFHRTIDLHASAWQPVLDLEAQGPRRWRRSPCLRHLSEVVEARLPDLGKLILDTLNQAEIAERRLRAWGPQRSRSDTLSIQHFRFASQQFESRL